MNYAPPPNDDGIGVPAQQALVNFMDNHDVTRFLFDKPSTAGAATTRSPSSSPRTASPASITAPSRSSTAATIRPTASGCGTRASDRRRRRFSTIQKLIKIRKAYAPLRRGDHDDEVRDRRTSAMEEDAGMFAFERADGGHKVLVVHQHVSDAKQSETSTALMGGSDMLTSFAPGDKLVDMLASPSDATATFTVGLQGALKVPVAARGARDPGSASGRGAATIATGADGAASASTTSARTTARRASSATCRSRSPTASCWCWSGRRAAASRRCSAASPGSRS